MLSSFWTAIAGSVDEIAGNQQFPGRFSDFPLAQHSVIRYNVKVRKIAKSLNI